MLTLTNGTYLNENSNNTSTIAIRTVKAMIVTTRVMIKMLITTTITTTNNNKIYKNDKNNNILFQLIFMQPPIGISKAW